MRLLLVGFGAVNQTLSQLIAERAAAQLTVVGVCDSRGGAMAREGFDLERLLAHKGAGESVAAFPGADETFADAEALEAGCEYDVLVEASPVDLDSPDGGVPLRVSRAALAGGRALVLANKSPLVTAFAELEAAAAASGAQLRYSATVCGGLPVVNVGRRDLLKTNFTAVRGIFNSTSNYVLHEMAGGGDYATALRAAQDIGVAEADPRLDMEGVDTANKLVIIANAVLGVPTALRDVRVTGVQDVGVAQLQAAAAEGCVIKLVAEGRRAEDSGEWAFSVAPRRVPADSFLGTTSAWEMCVQFESDLYPVLSMRIDERDPVPTAAAVLRDVLCLL